MRLRCALALVFAFAYGPTLAQYKCVVNGRSLYQDRPCDGTPSTQLKLHSPSGLGESTSTSSTASEIARKLERARQERINQAIVEQRPEVGMTLRELEAALGKPTRANMSSSGATQSNQLIYERGQRTWYVYTNERELVTSYQNTESMSGRERRPASPPRDALIKY